MGKNRNKKVQSIADKLNKEMSFGEYYEIFIKPSLEILAEEKAQRLGVAFIRWIVYGKQPHFKQDSDKLLWNALMLACNKVFNPIIETMTAIEVSKELQQSDKAASSKTCKDSFADRVFREIIK